MRNNAPESRKAGRLRISLRFVLLVVAFCCIVAFLVPWGMRRIALDPFSPAADVRDQILRDPFTERDVKRSTPHSSEVFDSEGLPLDLEKADAATIEKLKQSADVMYADVPLEEVLDDISTKYDIALDVRAIAGTDARVVLAMAGLPLQSVLETVLRSTNLHCEAKGTVMVIRPRPDGPPGLGGTTSPQGTSTSEENADGAQGGGDASAGKTLDPSAK